MASVFLSYSREDRPRAQQVVAALEAGGCSVWWDGLIEGGARFSEATEAALDAAEVVVVLWSKASVKSHWVHDEATRGRDRGRLVPASIDGSAPPLGFGQFQALDLSKWKGRPKAPEIDNLLHAIGIATGQPELAPAHHAPVAAPDRRKVLIGGGAAVLLAGGGLAAWKSGLFAPAAKANSIAVLPFRNLSGDPGQDYFAEGIAEEIRNTLARNPLLKVIATASSAASRKSDAGLGQIAQQLGVANILDGSVRRAGDVVRITVQLADQATGAAVWTEKFDRDFSDILRLQTEISEKVLQVLNIQFSGAGYSVDSIRSAGGTDNPAAFDEFLKGRAAFEQFDQTGFRKAIEHFRQARTIDPNYAAAYAGEARCTHLSADAVETLRARDALEAEALILAQRSLNLAANAPYPLIVMAMVLQDRLRFKEAGSYLERAYVRAPRSFDVPMAYGLFKLFDRDFAIARESIMQAVSTDPLNPRLRLGVLNLHFYMGEMDRALQELESINEKFPDFAAQRPLHSFQFVGHLLLGNFDAAYEAATKAPDPMERAWRHAIIDLRRGKADAAVQWLENLERRGAKTLDDFYNKWVLLAQIGKIDEATAVLKKQFDARNYQLLIVNVDPLVEPLRKLPEFRALMRKIGFTER